MAVGDRVCADGAEYVVVWSPGRDAPSLLDNYSRPSTLAEVSQDSARILSQRHKADRLKRTGYVARQSTYDRAKADLKRMGVL